MGLKTFGSGWDPNSGWAPDDSTSIPWDPEADIPGQFKGGGAGFGPGGFQGNPKLTAPASGPTPGMSLSTTGGGAPAVQDPPVNRGASGPGFAGWRNPFTAPHVDPTTGQPEMLTGPGGLVEKTRGAVNPFGFIGGGNPYWRGAIAGAGAIAPTPAETGEFNPAMITGRPDAPLPLHMPARPVTPTPTTAYPPASGPAAPVAGPAATRQRPNLGTYGGAAAPVIANSPFTTLDYRPNSGPNERNRGSPVATALDLSQLFGGGQPAPAAAAPATPSAPPAKKTLPDVTSKAPSDYGPLRRNRIWGFKGDPALRSEGKITMSMRETDLVGEVQILKGIHYANPNFVSEMTTLVSALGGDTTTHSAEIEAPPLALRIDPSHSRLTNDAILLVNTAKAGNLTKFQIIAAFDDALGIAHAPANVAVPYASAAGAPIVGTVCTVTMGQWTGSPTSYTYVWTRDGTNIGGATAATYTLVSADIGGHAIRAVVTAVNATGSTAAPPSNPILT